MKWVRWRTKRRLLKGIVKSTLRFSRRKNNQEIVLVTKSLIRFSTSLSAFVVHWVNLNCLGKICKTGISNRGVDGRMTGSHREARTWMIRKRWNPLNFTPMLQRSSVESAKYSESSSKITCSLLGMSKSLLLSSIRISTTSNLCCQRARVEVSSIILRTTSIW